METATDLSTGLVLRNLRYSLIPSTIGLVILMCPPTLVVLRYALIIGLVILMSALILSPIGLHQQLSLLLNGD
jgi:hypothetical protein